MSCHQSPYITCTKCAPVFSSLYWAKNWMDEEYRKRGFKEKVPCLHYNAIIARDRLLTMITMGKLVAWVYTPFANHKYQNGDYPHTLISKY